MSISTINIINNTKNIIKQIHLYNISNTQNETNLNIQDIYNLINTFKHIFLEKPNLCNDPFFNKCTICNKPFCIDCLFDTGCFKFTMTGHCNKCDIYEHLPLQIWHLKMIYNGYEIYTIRCNIIDYYKFDNLKINLIHSTQENIYDNLKYFIEFIINRIV